MAEERESRTIAEQTLKDVWHCDVQLGEGEELGGSNRSHVYRCSVEARARSSVSLILPLGLVCWRRLIHCAMRSRPGSLGLTPL